MLCRFSSFPIGVASRSAGGSSSGSRTGDDPTLTRLSASRKLEPRADVAEVLLLVDVEMGVGVSVSGVVKGVQPSRKARRGQVVYWISCLSANERKGGGGMRWLKKWFQKAFKRIQLTTRPVLCIKKQQQKHTTSIST